MLDMPTSSLADDCAMETALHESEHANSKRSTECTLSDESKTLTRGANIVDIVELWKPYQGVQRPVKRG